MSTKIFSLYGELELATLNFNSGVEAARSRMYDLQLEMGDVQNEANRTSTILDGALGHALGDILSGVTQAAIEAAAMVVRDGVGLASSMEEVWNVIDTTFGSNANRIQIWSETTKSAFGIGELAAKEFSGTMGSTLKGLGIEGEELYSMSTALVELAGDMASFRNLDIATAFQKILSGMTGESEPLKSLGIVMSVANLEAHALAMGIETAWGKMDQATQTQVRYSYLMKQSADMQGDFAKTSESYSNQMRLLEENIEELKLSVGQTLLPVLSELVGWFNSLFGSTKNVEDGFKTVSDVYNSTYVSIETTTTNALALIQTLEEMQNATDGTAEGSELWNGILAELKATLPELSGLIDTTTGSITGGTEALREYVEGWATMAKQLAEQEAVQGYYTSYGQTAGEIAALKTEQQIAEIRAAAALEKMAELENLLMSSAEGYSATNAKSAWEAIAGRYDPSDVLWYEQLQSLYSAGYTDADIERLAGVYMAQAELYAEKSAVNNSDRIAELERLLSQQEEEIALLQQILAKDTEVQVSVTLDGENVAAQVEKRIYRGTKAQMVAFGG